MTLKKILAAPVFIFLWVCGGMAVSTVSGQVIDDSQVDNQLASLRSVSETAHDDNRRFRPPGKIRIRYMSSEARARTTAQLENLALGGHRELLLPAAKYFHQYADFLRDNKTGLARVFPDLKCDRGMVVDVSELERCKDVYPLLGVGSHYSFRNRTNLNRKTWADINFVDDKFVAGGQTEFGLIGELGDVAPDSLTLKSKELAFLKDYKPKTKTSQITAEREIFVKGLTVNGLTYKLSAPATLNSTYVLRSVAYALNNFDGLDIRLDIIVVFKVISRENDGSLILLWKQLKSDPARPLKE
ncbi:MAG TPA: hypothetical protein VGO50_03115 [Pyrinomonadaceae bacterium]|jgi:hypothetical protein|nr:hypothetical protein [Pyrinomonadaceae bacterium]